MSNVDIRVAKRVSDNDQMVIAQSNEFKDILVAQRPADCPSWRLAVPACGVILGGPDLHSGCKLVRASTDPRVKEA